MSVGRQDVSAHNISICTSTEITSSKRYFIRKYLKPNRNTCTKNLPENAGKKGSNVIFFFNISPHHKKNLFLIEKYRMASQEKKNPSAKQNKAKAHQKLKGQKELEILGVVAGIFKAVKRVM